MRKCTNCKWAVYEVLAGDDERLFCSAPETSHGYVSLSGEDGENCSTFREGRPRHENLLVEITEVPRPPAIKPLFMVAGN